MKTRATLEIETVYTFGGAPRSAVRVILHDDDGRKPRGKRGKGTLVAGYADESDSALLRVIADLLDHHGWEKFDVAKLEATS